MWIICQADDSHVMSSIISSEKYEKACFENVVCQSWLALLGSVVFYIDIYVIIIVNAPVVSAGKCSIAGQAIIHFILIISNTWILKCRS